MVDLGTLLTRTSRTFALAIPELPEPTRREVEIAYLLFRIADTFEDATLWSPARKTAALAEFEALVAEDPEADAIALARAWHDDPPVEHEGYVELLGRTDDVLAALAELRPGAQRVIRRHVARTARGMADYARRDGELDLQTLEELRDYCYVVAGIVGEMLTELFVLERPELSAAAPGLETRARYFGEGLQLTNIVKDAAGDVEEGRSFLPSGTSHKEVFALAREDLRLAEEYVTLLERSGAPAGLVGFNAMPVLLAWETLNRVEAQGPGAKLTREEVFRLVADMHRALAEGEPVMAGVGGGRAQA
jgi:farnesyl-diphosphate farnesyltransferase